MYYYDEPLSFGEPNENPPSRKGGGFGDWLKNAGKNVGDFINGGGASNALDVVNKTLCTINPNRPGCYQETVYIQQQRRNNMLLLVLALVVIAVTVFFILKKKK